MDILLITSYTLICVCVIFAFFILSRNFRSLVNLSFSLGMLSLACVAAGDVLALQDSWDAVKWKKLSMAGEALFPASWLLFTAWYGAVRRKLPLLSFTVLYCALSILMVAAAAVYPTQVFMYSPQLPTEPILYLEANGYYYYLLIAMAAIIALVRLESLLWATKGAVRWNVKYAVIGVGGLLGMFVYYYSYPVLYRTIEMKLIPVRNSIFLVSTILLVAAFVRQKFLDVEVFISRKVIFRSASLLAVGGYFILLGLLGEGMRYFGEDFSENLVLFLAFLGLMGFIAFFLAEKFRTRAKRLIIDNFYRHRYEYKDEWLQFTDMLSSADSMSEVVRECLNIMVDTFGVTGASYWAIRESDGICRLEQSTSSAMKSADLSMDIHSPLIRLARIGAIYDRNQKEGAIERLHGEIFESNAISIVIPILSNEKLLGLIMLGKNIAGFRYDDEDYELMLTLARQGAYAIDKTALSQELAESREMEAMGRVTSFVMHDLKNMTNSLSMLLENAKDYIGDPEFQQDMLKTVGSSVDRMSSVMRKLSRLRASQEFRKRSLDLTELVKDVVTGLAIPKGVALSLELEESLPVFADGEELRKVLVNIILNAVEAMNGRGDIVIGDFSDGAELCVKISDTGPGMSRKFVENELFKPFRTTKRGGLGIGMYHCQSIMKGHGGRIQVESTEGKGSMFSICLPRGKRGDS